jgi:hypothetical protein
LAEDEEEEKTPKIEDSTNEDEARLELDKELEENGGTPEERAKILLEHFPTQPPAVQYLEYLQVTPAYRALKFT